MSSLNKVSLIGRLGADPEITFTTKKKPVCKFSIATDDGVKNEKGESVPQWHKIVAWEDLAETCAKYLVKGRQVYVEGRLKNEEWVDKETSKKMRRTVISAYSVRFLDSPKKYLEQDSQPPKFTPKPDTKQLVLDDL